MKRTAGCFFLAAAALLSCALVRARAAEPVFWQTQDVPRLDDWLSEVDPAIQVYDFILDDFDADGQLERCELRTDTNQPLFLAIRELAGSRYTYPGHPLFLDPKDYHFFPLGGRGRCRFATYRRAGDHGWIDLYNHRAERIDSLATLGGEDFSGDGIWSGNLLVFASADLNGDERPELIARFNTGADRQPRALLAYDLATRQRVLEYHFAPMIEQVVPADVNGDGAIELVVTLGGASDGADFGRFRRDSSYVAVLAGDGRLLAAKAYGGESSYVNVRVVDLDGDTRPEIIAAPFSLVQSSPLRVLLQVLDGRSLSVKAALENAADIDPFYAFEVGDLAGDGLPEIIAGDLTDHVAVIRYDPVGTRLTIETEARNSGRTRPVLADDLDLDGVEELFFVTYTPPALWLTDAALHPIAWMSLKNPGHFKMAAHDRQQAAQRSFSLLDGTRLCQLSIPAGKILAQNPPGFLLLGRRIVLGPTLALILPGLILLFLLILLAGGLRLHYLLHFPGQVSSNRVGFALINGRERISHCNPRFLKMIGQDRRSVLKHPAVEVLRAAHLEEILSRLQLFNQRQEVYEQHELELTSEGRIQKAAAEFFRIQRVPAFVMLLLIDLSESTEKERLKIWAAMAQRMAHKTKTPLATVLLAIQRLQRAYRKDSPERAQAYDEMTRTALHEIERVRDTINAFMKFARLEPPVFVPDDFSRVVQETLQEYLPRIPDEVQLRTHFESLDLPVHIDISQFKEACYNLLDNAITAMQGEGVVNISTLREKNPLSTHGEGDTALLEISDNGRGIAAGDLPQIFQTGFSTSSSGTGLGLSLARSIIESHNGSIEIDSREGSGTTVFVRLPLH